MKSTSCRFLFLCFCLVAATAASAQAIYRQVDLAGGVIYTDRPDSTLPGGAEPLVGTPSPAQVEKETPPRPAVRRSQISRQQSVAIDAREAERRLQQARLNRERGVEPIPGEKDHGAGAQALKDRYYRRQEQLRREVEMALRRVNETQQMLLAHR
jgi:hypothetical protein